ncbi:MAG: PorV/PorQ family protein [Bacteroidetes bacterium]|nr:PorV/PorQ family protein [Bacteroidota bacterium]
MKVRIMLFIVCALFVAMYQLNGEERVKLAQSGFKFLSVVSDARGAAMAEALTSLEAGSSSLFFNPAGMATLSRGLDLSVSQNQWIADIRHYTFSIAFRPGHGQYGVLGFTIQSVDYGEFYGTRVNQTMPEGFEDTGIFSLKAMALGLGYARQLTDRFSVGAHVRFVRQNLGESMVAQNVRLDPNDPTGTARIADTAFTSNRLVPLVVDFGTRFHTGYKSLVFGMSIRNFSNEVKYAQEGFQAPLMFTLGISMNVLDFFDPFQFDHSLVISIDASHHRDHPEQIKVGLEYQALNIVSLRCGYMSANDESSLSYGIGVTAAGIVVDYAYTPFGIFNKVQRFTARFSL